MLPLLAVPVLMAGCPGNAKLRYDGGKDGRLVRVSDLPRLPVLDRLSGSGERARNDITLTTLVGGPCPCATPLLCVKDACRKMCTTRDCNAEGDCEVGQTCAMTSARVAVCVPGPGDGQECTAETPCAAGCWCFTTNPTSGKGMCYPSCTTEGATCTYGVSTGKCNRPDPQQACLYCYGS